MNERPNTAMIIHAVAQMFAATSNISRAPEFALSGNDSSGPGRTRRHKLKGWQRNHRKYGFKCAK